MRLLFLNRSFWPDPEATGQFMTELCQDLSCEHDVTIVAGPSYYVTTRHKALFARETLGKVSIIRTWGTKLSKTNLLGRLINLGSYYVIAGLASLRTERPDIVIAETDPPLLGALGALLKQRWRCRLVYNVRDLYPDIAEVTGGVKNRFLRLLLERTNEFAYRAADLIIALGSDMRERLLQKALPSEKIAVVTDWVDCNALRPQAASSLRVQFEDRFVVMYSGNLGLSQQLEVVLEAADRLRNDKSILFVLIGEGARKKRLQDEMRSKRLSNVWFLPYQPKERLGESLTAADLHLIPLMAGAAGCMVPSKVYGVLAAGRPFVAMMEDFADVARLAVEHRVGFVTPPGDVDGLVATIRGAMNNPAELKEMGRRARRLAEEQFERRVVTRKFAQLLETVAAANGSAINC